MLGVTADKQSNGWYIADQNWVAMSRWVPFRYVSEKATGERKLFLAEDEAFDVKKRFIQTGEFSDDLCWGKIIHSNN